MSAITGGQEILPVHCQHKVYIRSEPNIAVSHHGKPPRDQVLNLIIVQCVGDHFDAVLFHRV